jgi:hypothetical protein
MWIDIYNNRQLCVLTNTVSVCCLISYDLTSPSWLVNAKGYNLWAIHTIIVPRYKITMSWSLSQLKKHAKTLKMRKVRDCKKSSEGKLRAKKRRYCGTFLSLSLSLAALTFFLPYSEEDRRKPTPYKESEIKWWERDKPTPQGRWICIFPLSLSVFFLNLSFLLFSVPLSLSFKLVKSRTRKSDFRHWTDVEDTLLQSLTKQQKEKGWSWNTVCSTFNHEKMETEKRTEMALKCRLTNLTRNLTRDRDKSDKKWKWIRLVVVFTVLFFFCLGILQSLIGILQSLILLSFFQILQRWTTKLSFSFFGSKNLWFWHRW